MDIPFVERVKIQAQVLVPLVKALRAELGEERANELVKGVWDDMNRSFGKRWWQQQSEESPNGRLKTLIETFAAGDALDYEMTADDEASFDFDVHRCGYAEFFKKIGEPELGFLFCCSADAPMTEGFEAGVELEVPQTIMQGATHCQFRYKLK